MTTSIVAALVFGVLSPSGNRLYWFPVLFGISLAGSIMGTYLAPPTAAAVLHNFYRTVRP